MSGASGDNKTENSIELILETMLDAVVAIDDDGIVVGWNNIATQIFQWTQEEALGVPMVDLIVPPHLRDAHINGLRYHQETGIARVLNQRIEISARDKAGRQFPVELAIVTAPPGGRAAFIGFIRDISERQSASERLALSEESLRLATDAAEIGTWDLDLTTGVLTWSDRTKAMFGISPGVPCSMADFYAGLHPDDSEVTTIAFASALDPAVRDTYDVQYRTVGKEDGLVRWVAAKGKGIFLPDGKCVRAVGTAIDITERRRVEARQAFMLELTDVLRGLDADTALHDASALMGRHFGVSRVGYGHLDPIEDVFDYDVCWTDGSVPPLLGKFPAKAFGTKIVAKLSAGETVVVEDLFADTVSDESLTRETATEVDTRSILVVPFVRAGRLRTIVYLNDRHARHWESDDVAFMEAVAERTRQMIARREAETALKELNATLEARVEQRTAELRTAEDALRQAQKMEVVGQLTGGIAHDFNNLLQGISGSLEMIQHRIGQGRTDELDRYIDAATTSATRAAALTHRLLAFARRQPLDPRPVQANPLIGSMADLLKRTLGERIQFDLQLSPDLWATLCDPNQLENALLNLVINARDAMPDGGTLVIGTDNATLQADATGGDVSPGQYVCISVTDTGAGMSEDTIAKAFEPFFTTKPIGQGTGLGLSMIYGFVRQSEGHARIDSELGKGTTVKLHLPRLLNEIVLEEDVSVPAAGRAPHGGEVILVLEDEPIVRRLIVDTLRDVGYHVSEAGDGPQGLEMLRSGTAIDLLLTDVGLPGLNGRQVADIARETRPDLKVLFMTGYAENAAQGASFLGPGMEIIAKPFTIEILTHRVRAIMDDEG